MNRLPQGEQLKASYDQHAARIREQYAATLGRTRWALVRGSSGGGFFSDYPTSWSGVVLADAGFRFGQFAEGRTGAGGRLSYEQAPAQLEDCDVVLHLADTRGGVDANTQTLLAQPAFQQVRAVREGRLFPLPNYYCSHYKQGEAVQSYLQRSCRGSEGAPAARRSSAWGGQWWPPPPWPPLPRNLLSIP